MSRKSTIRRDTLADGVQISRIELRNAKGYWVGDVFLEYGVMKDGKTWGRYFSITDFGNYSFAWFSIGDEPFEHFICKLAQRDQDYFMGKLLLGHDAGNVFRMDRTMEQAERDVEESFTDGLIDEAEKEEALEVLQSCESAEDIDNWYREQMNDPNGYERFVYGRSPRADGYERNVLPLLAEVLDDR